MPYRLLALLSTMAVIAYVQRAAISVPLKSIAADLQVADFARDMGWVQSAWYAGYAVMQLPSGWLADRLGSRLAIVWLCLSWSLLTLAAGGVWDFWSLVIVWGLMGAAQAGAFPCATKAIGQTFSEHQRAGAVGILIAGMQVGGALAPLITGLVIAGLAQNRLAPQFASWRICLWLYGIPGIVWALSFWLLISARDLPRTTSKSKPSGPVRWDLALTSLPLGLLCLQQFLRAAGMVFFLTWFPVFLQHTRGASQLESGVLTFIAGAAGTLGSLTGGFASDGLLHLTANRRLSRQGIAVAGLAMCSALIGSSYLVTDTRWAIALISLGVFCATFGGVSSYTVAIDFGGKQVATVFSTMNMCGNIGAMLFPIAIGWLVAATGNWNFALFTFAGVMALAAVCWTLLNPRGTLFGDEDESGPYTPVAR